MLVLRSAQRTLEASMTSSSVLITTALWLGVFHTMIGPDHYLPFIVLAKSRAWSLRKTLGLTAICGVLHVSTSVLLGSIGVSLGIALQHLEFVESFRGVLAAYGMIGFGLLYAAWGLRNAMQSKTHEHDHGHTDSSNHAHEHSHRQDHAHVHASGLKTITPWALFILFALGPCEILIPLLMFPAAQGSWLLVGGVVLAFGLATILSMLVIVGLSLTGLQMVDLRGVTRYAHVIAGLTIALSGVGVQFLEL
jgi:ABC-type nickel/cobalt efflux system permease component RcnA